MLEMLPIPSMSFYTNSYMKDACCLMQFHFRIGDELILICHFIISYLT